MVDERDIDAGERALGLDPIAEESLTDRLLREAWDERLAPLTARIPPAPLSADLLERIEAVIDTAETPDAPAVAPLMAPANDNSSAANVVSLDAMRKSASRWKMVASSAMAIAAALAIYIAVPVVNPPAAAKYVAVVTADDGGEAGLIIQVDTGTGIATVIPVAAPPSGNSYEMWHLPQGATQPVSLGLLPQNAVARSTIRTQPGELFAISLEPVGGSPTGQPTQALYHGTVVEVK